MWRRHADRRGVEEAAFTKYIPMNTFTGKRINVILETCTQRLIFSSFLEQMA